MKTSISDDFSYINVCEKCLIDQNVFLNFKSDSNYTNILEHVSYSEGLGYIEEIKRNNEKLLKNISKFKTNDDIGNPKRFFYSELNEYLSPTTLRYVKVLSDLIDNFGSLENLDVVEIGVGYGGQCKIISDIFNFKSYTLIDLDSVLKLSELYLNNFGIENLIFKTLDEIKDDVKYDLVISNYAFTEIQRNIQDQYKNKIIDNSENGYLTCNFFDYNGNSTVLINNILSYSVSDILKINDGIKISEEPETSPTNFIYIWKK